MCSLLDKLISPIQSTFNLGRWIVEDGLLMQYIIHSFVKKKGTEGLIEIKLHVQKTYDGVEWNFLLKVIWT